jgi:hypothetical protein
MRPRRNRDLPEANRVRFDLHLCPALDAHGKLEDELVGGDLMLPNL